MAIVAVGQLTITDTNDSISTGTTAPASPVENVTLWVDTSLSPNQLKKWTGTAWEIVNEVVIGGRNLVLNSNFSKYAVGTTPAWDTALNGTYGSVSNWSSGYNAWVTSPSVGYHAHLDTSTFGYPVLSLIDRNTTYGYAHRWMGINQVFADANSYVRKAISTGVKITMSAEVYADTIGAKVQFGLYHYMLSTGTQNFDGLLINTKNATSDDLNKWVKRSITFTVNDNWDVSKQFQAFIYGNTSAVECSNYVRNVKLEIGNVSTDWTAAPEDVDVTIATAQGTANAAAQAAALAQTDATNALNKLTAITSDNVLSAGSEKSSQRLSWNTIAAEKASINAQATAFGVTTENTAYNSAFQTLATYLNNGTTWSAGVPSWISDANLSINTTIVGATYRSNWEAFYTARIALLNAISAKVKALADAAQATADAKSRHFTGSANPSPPYTQGLDTWTNGTDLYECAVTRVAGAAYVAGDFVKATGYDNTKTAIDGGVVTSGTVQLAGDASTILAGITGQGTASTSVRVWAGGSFAARATANFRVLQSGDAYTKGGFYIQDANSATIGGFRGNITADSGVVLWFGNATPENGNLIMQRNGSIILNNASLTSRYNNNDNGDSVVINSGALSFRYSGVETGYVKSKHILMNGNYSEKIDIQPESLRMDHRNGSVGVSFFTYNNTLLAKFSSGITGGLQITMENLPTTAPALANEVWRDSNGFLKIT